MHLKGIIIMNNCYIIMHCANYYTDPHHQLQIIDLATGDELTAYNSERSEAILRFH